MIFRLTKKAQTQLKNPVLEPLDGENRYCEWFVNLIIIERKKYFIITNAYSFLSIVFPARGINSAKIFYEIAYNELKGYFEKTDMSEFFNEYIEPNTKNMYASATNSKSVIGSMNGLIEYAKCAFDDAGSLFEFNQSINEYIVFLKGEFKNTPYPIEAIKASAMKEPIREYNYESNKTKKTKIKPSFYKNIYGEILTDPKMIAQDMCWTAWEIPNDTKAGIKDRKKLVEEALLYDPNCTDAYCILAEDCTTYSQQLKYAKKAKLAFEKEHAKSYFDTNKGDFYALLETRPYMSALWYCTEALLEMGEEKEAIEIMEYILDLNPNDNLGVRFQLSEIYAQDGNKKDLALLEKKFEDL